MERVNEKGFGMGRELSRSSGHEVITFFMLNSTEHKIPTAHKNLFIPAFSTGKTLKKMGISCF